MTEEEANAGLVALKLEEDAKDELERQQRAAANLS